MPGCLVCFAFPGALPKELQSSWRLLFTRAEICDKEHTAQPCQSQEQHGAAAEHKGAPGPGAAALGGSDQRLPDQLLVANLHFDGFIMGKSELRAGLGFSSLEGLCAGLKSC